MEEFELKDLLEAGVEYRSLLLDQNGSAVVQPGDLTDQAGSLMKIAIDHNQLQVVQYLLHEVKCDPCADVPGSKKARTILHYACEKAQDHQIIIEFAKAIRNNEKSTWNVRDKQMNTPQHLLVKNKKLMGEPLLRLIQDLMSAYVDMIDLNAVNKNGESVLDLANSPDLISCLQAHGAVQYAPIRDMIEDEDIEVLKQSIRDAHLEIVGPNGTLLQFATELSYPREMPEVVKVLLDRGADPNLTAADINPVPPIFIAARKLHVDCFRVLLESDATKVDIEVVEDEDHDAIEEETKIDITHHSVRFNLLHSLIFDRASQTPFSFEDVEQQKYWDMIQKVCSMLETLFQLKPEEARSIVNDEDRPTKNTPLHYATLLEGGQVAKILLDHGAEQSLFQLNSQGRMPLKMISTDMLRDLLNKQIKPEAVAGVTSLSDNFKLVLQNELFFPHLHKNSSASLNFGTDLTKTMVKHDTFGSSSEVVHFDDDYYSPDKDFHIPELEKVAMLQESHMDLFDHPVVSSMILAKWQNVRLFFAISSSLKVAQHIFGILYVFATYSGFHFPLMGGGHRNCSSDLNVTMETSKEDFCSQVCCPRELSNSLLVLLQILWLINVARKSVEVMSLFVKATSKASSFLANIGANLMVWISKSENMLAVVINGIVVPHMMFLLYFDSSRDIAGFYTLLASFDLFLVVRDHIGNRKLASMITWTQVVSRSILVFLLMYALIIFGFLMNFYIQLHNDIPKSEEGEDDDDDGNPFKVWYYAPLKIIAMSVGELEYGDFPFRSGLILNYLAFVLFIYFIILVMMNLLTGIALMDAQEITNQSTDLTWYETLLKINFLENTLIRLRLHKLRRSALVFRNSPTVVIYPNLPSNGMVHRNRDEIYVQEVSIKTSVKEIVTTLVNDNL